MRTINFDKNIITARPQQQRVYQLSTKETRKIAPAVTLSDLNNFDQSKAKQNDTCGSGHIL